MKDILIQCSQNLFEFYLSPLLSTFTDVLWKGGNETNYTYQEQKSMCKTLKRSPCYHVLFFFIVTGRKTMKV